MHRAPAGFRRAHHVAVSRYPNDCLCWSHVIRILCNWHLGESSIVACCLHRKEKARSSQCSSLSAACRHRYAKSQGISVQTRRIKLRAKRQPIFRKKDSSFCCASNNYKERQDVTKICKVEGLPLLVPRMQVRFLHDPRIFISYCSAQRALPFI